MAWGEPSHAETLLALGGRLVTHAKAYVEAEVDVVKQTGLVYVRAARGGLILALLAVLLLLSALPVLIAAIGMTLAIWIGTAGGLWIATLIAILIAGLLAWIAMRRLMAIGEKVK